MEKLNKKNNRLPIFCYDIYLKSLFTKYPSILEKFIADVTDIDYELLKGKTELATNEIPISRKNEKGKRCDFIVTAKGQKNWVINIELNYHYSDGLRERNCAYVSSLFSRAFQKGVIYDNSSKVYQINIDCFKEKNNIKTIDECNIKRINNTILCQNLKIFNLNVDKLSKIYYNKFVNSNNGIPKYCRWAALFLVRDCDEIPEICKGILNESEVKQVMDEFNELTKEDLLMTKEEAERWGKLYADIIYNDGVNDGIEKGISQGYDKGKSEGIMQGHFEGLKRGIEQGIEQNEKDNIISMYKNNIDISIISKVINKDEQYIKSIIY